MDAFAAEECDPAIVTALDPHGQATRAGRAAWALRTSIG